MAEKTPQQGDRGDSPIKSTSSTKKNDSNDEKDDRKLRNSDSEEIRSVTNNQPIASVKRKLKTLTFGRRYKSGASKDGSKKKRKATWAFKFKNRLKCSAEPDIAEPNIGCNTCICTGYRRTEEHHLGAGVVFSATPPAGRKLMAHPHLLESKTLRREPVIDLLKFNPDDYPVEDWDEQLRAQRAREMQEGIEPPPGFIVSTNPSANNVIVPNIIANPIPPPNPFDTLDSNFQIISLATAFQNHVSIVPYRNLDSLTVSSTLSREVEFFNQFARATAEAVWFHRTAVHTQVDYIHCLVPDLLDITNCSFYWGKMDRYEAERLLENKPEGTFLLRDSAQEEYLFSVSFRRYVRSLHARIEQWNHKFSFDSHDPGVFASNTVCGLIEHYKDPSCCMFFEPMLTIPLHRTFPFSLQHLCRAVICNNTTYDGINKLHLPKSLKIYLKEYHYKQRVRVRRLELEP